MATNPDLARAMLLDENHPAHFTIVSQSATEYTKIHDPVLVGGYNERIQYDYLSYVGLHAKIRECKEKAARRLLTILTNFNNMNEADKMARVDKVREDVGTAWQFSGWDDHTNEPKPIDEASCVGDQTGIINQPDMKAQVSAESYFYDTYDRSYGYLYSPRPASLSFPIEHDSDDTDDSVSSKAVSFVGGCIPGDGSTGSVTSAGGDTPPMAHSPVYQTVTTEKVAEIAGNWPARVEFR